MSRVSLAIIGSLNLVMFLFVTKVSALTATSSFQMQLQNGAAVVIGEKSIAELTAPNETVYLRPSP